MPRQAVDAPPATPPKYSLLIAAPTIDDGARWEAGVQFAPEGCGNGGRVPVECIGSTELLVPDDNGATVTADPFLVWAADQCSSFGFRARDYAGRALRQLRAIESFQIAAEVWGGSLNGEPILLGSSQTIANLELTDASSDTVTNGPSAEVTALANLVGALGACGKGRQGMIHMTPQMLERLVAAYAVYQVSGSWYTAMGHLVVADDGYDGSGPGNVPATTSQWMYATSMMRVRLGAVQTIPNIASSAPDGNFDPDDLAGNSVGWPGAVDPATNTVTVYAMRPALVQFDRCCLLAAEVDVPPPLTGGAS